jgi:hypothetical protein
MIQSRNNSLVYAGMLVAVGIGAHVFVLSRNLAHARSIETVLDEIAAQEDKSDAEWLRLARIKLAAWRRCGYLRRTYVAPPEPAWHTRPSSYVVRAAPRGSAWIEQ